MPAWRLPPVDRRCEPTGRRLSRSGTRNTALVSLTGSDDLTGYFLVVAPHPDGFSIPEREDADMVGGGRVRAERHYVRRVDVHGGTNSGVHKLGDHRKTSMAVL